ncbi:MAG: radical SAM protein, partial [Phycisphaerae bacterium]|nr:radical SAM protein [Phycisphaerae bacterium]
IARDEKWYYESHGAGGAGGGGCCGGGGGGAAQESACCGSAAQVSACCTPASSASNNGPGATSTNPFETLSTCIALIEIVDSCNLTCPTCYAESPYGVNERVDCTPFEQIVSRVNGVVQRKGAIDILQLSGGEPTIHPEFERVLRWAVTQPKIGYVLVNTNLVRVAGDERFRAMLADVRANHGKFELYAQFDGVQQTGQTELRGADLRAMRERAIDLAGALGVPTTLAMVVDERTLPGIGDTLRWALARPHVRGITFQPVFTSGRVAAVESHTLPMFAKWGRDTGLGVGDVIKACTEHAPELLCADDFTPLPCGDPNCHTIGYMLRTDDGPVGMSRLIDLPMLQGFLSNRVNYNLNDLARCGCETEPLGELLKALEIGPEKPFRIFIKPFMDAMTFDQDRIDRCCTHVVTPDGTLDSFCRYYLNGGRHGSARLAERAREAAR